MKGACFNGESCGGGGKANVARCGDVHGKSECDTVYSGNDRLCAPFDRRNSVLEALKWWIMWAPDFEVQFVAEVIARTLM
jgi:hypothetical protein